MNNTIGLVSLGCAKNEIDAQLLLGALREAGYAISPNPNECGVVIINTCGFIESAKQEAIDTILEFAALKQARVVGALLVTGCLAQRYKDELAGEMPEVDGALGIGGNGEIVRAVEALMRGERYFAFGEREELPFEGSRMLTGPAYSVYLKIAEGCDNRCSFCAIPDIRGRFRSRPKEKILAEARRLIEAGAVELNLVAQDTTRYGEDIYGRLALPELLRELCKIDGLRWLRLLYCYPDRMTDELLETMAAQPKIVKYIDLPVQHGVGKVLREMNRSGDASSLLGLLEKIRRMIPGVVLRTTLIAGFPGESEEEFTQLCEFVQAARFERLGCFAYSQEEGTPAGERTDQLDEETKRRRADIIMETQAGIALEIAAGMTGQTLEVLCEGHDKQRQEYFGRAHADAPDIDTKVYFTADTLPTAGSFVTVEITGAEGYDLVGSIK
ncbi:MAG: 30S ribosomal protein S12 methylthiotransferase RimO [Oscillospiraceae bacterium]|nr:30S ribosomal protein S12 methylthiotransferase RimO [Oscillospiraceae bacterium]